MLDTGIANRIRATGVRVQESSGWKGRHVADTNFNPHGGVLHHTVSRPTSNTPTLRTVMFGRSDLSGPLCQVLQAWNDTAVIIAAGTANHAGSGGWRGLTGNSSVYGIEVEHDGTSPLGMDRARISAKIMAALIHGRAGARMVCQHWEWSDAGKIDVATDMHPGKNPSNDDFRQMVAVELRRLDDKVRFVLHELEKSGEKYVLGKAIAKTGLVAQNRAKAVPKMMDFLGNQKHNAYDELVRDGNFAVRRVYVD